MPQFSPDIEAFLDGKPLAICGEAYDAASRFDNEVALWMPPAQSADMAIIPNKGLADARTNDVMRNDAHVAAGANLHRNGIVGAIFLLNAKPETKVLGLDDTWETEFQEEVETKFTLWAESLNNWVDAARINTLTGLVRLAVGVHLGVGEVLASVEWMKPELGRPFRTAIQMIDSDRLSTPYTLMDSKNLRGGVERDNYGAPLAYHVRVAHPSDYTSRDSYIWKRVQASKPWGRPQIIHIFEQTRPDQSRGMSQMVAALKETRIASQFRDMVLQNAVAQATFAATIESELPAELIAAQLGVGQSSAAEALGGFVSGYLTQLQTYIKNAKGLTLNGVKIPHLYPGTKMKLLPAGQGGPLGNEFEASLLRHLSAILEVSYEELSHDYTKTNYSSAKAGIAKTEQAMAAKKKAVADRFASIIYRLWFEEALNKDQITSLPKDAKDRFYNEPLMAEAFTGCDWIGASKGQIDELKETQAAVLRIANGLSTWEIEISRLGRDYRKQFRQEKREMELRVAAKLPMPAAQNMMNAATGQPDNTGAAPNGGGQ